MFMFPLVWTIRPDEQHTPRSISVLSDESVSDGKKFETGKAVDLLGCRYSHEDSIFPVEFT